MGRKKDWGTRERQLVHNQNTTIREMNTESGQSEMAMPAVIVLDMDGLMFNTEDIYDASGQELLGRRGMEFTLELKRRMMGRTAQAAFGEMRDFLKLAETVEKLQIESDEIWLRLLPERIAKLQGLDWLLDSADRYGIPLAVATSSPGHLANRAMSHFDLGRRFRHIVTGDMVTFGKPDPEIYLTVAGLMGVSAKRMLVFEDSPVGSTAAVASGARTIAVPGAHNDGEDYSHVWRVVDSLDSPAVRDLFGSWTGSNYSHSGATSPNP